MTARDEHQQRITSLLRLASATRTKLDPQDHAVYLDGTSGFSPETFAAACRHLETTAEFFPRLSEVVQACLAVVGERKRREELARPRLRDSMPDPISAERHAEIMAKLRELIGTKTINAVPRARRPGREDR